MLSQAAIRLDKLEKYAALAKKISECEDMEIEKIELILPMIEEIVKKIDASRVQVYEQHDDNYYVSLKENYDKKSLWVYFIKEGEHDRIKIGQTNNLKNRVKQLQTGNSNSLFIIGYIKMGDICSAIELEKNFHTYFDNAWIHGEWFNLNVENIFQVLRMYRKIGMDLFIKKQYKKSTTEQASASPSNLINSDAAEDIKVVVKRDK